jgi:hypothetical protein
MPSGPLRPGQASKTCHEKLVHLCLQLAFGAERGGGERGPGPPRGMRSLCAAILLEGGRNAGWSSRRTVCTVQHAAQFLYKVEVGRGGAWRKRSMPACGLGILRMHCMALGWKGSLGDFLFRWYCSNVLLSFCA